MVPDFVRLGFTAATPLPNQGFPARFLVSCIRSSSYYFEAFQKDRKTDSCLKQSNRSV